MKINKKKFKIAVLMGGFEPERFASNLTGENYLNALKEAGYENVVKLDVDQNIISKLEECKPDFALCALFCKWGEDGVIQSLLEIMGIPYSGNGVETSAFCKNKFLFNTFVKGCGLHSAETYFYGTKDDYEKQKPKLEHPCIVKPSYQGYSLGVAIVKNNKELKKAVEYAYTFSSRISIEEFIDGREFTVGIIEEPGNVLKVLPIAEVVLKGRLIQDTETKDDPSLVEEIVPARLSASLRKKLEKESLQLFKALSCSGVTRFDVRLSKKGDFYFMENNTCPGMLNFEQSDLPKQLDAIGIPVGHYVDNLVQVGLNRLPNKLEVFID